MNTSALSLRSGFLILAIGVLSIGCGGGGGSDFPGQPSGTSPMAWNLIISPNSAALNEGGGWIPVSVSVDFSDSEGDVYHIAINVLDTSGTLLYVAGADASSALGQTSGTARGTANLATDTLGQFTLRVWLVDESIRTSNKLDTIFTIS